MPSLGLQMYAKNNSYTNRLFNKKGSPFGLPFSIHEENVWRVKLLFHDFLDAEDLVPVADSHEIDAALQAVEIHFELAVIHRLRFHGLAHRIVNDGFRCVGIFIQRNDDLAVCGVRVEGEAAEELFGDSAARYFLSIVLLAAPKTHISI